MSRDQLSIFNPIKSSASPTSQLHSHFGNEADFDQPVAPAAKSSVRQQILDRIIDRFHKEDLLGKSYAEQYLLHMSGYTLNLRKQTLL